MTTNDNLEQGNTNQNDDSVHKSRRTFLKLGVAGAGLVAAAAGGVAIVKKNGGNPS